jgi:hypothetical protein
MPVILKIQSQPQLTVHETLSQKNPSQKRAGGVAQGEGPEFKTQYRKKKKKFYLMCLNFIDE